MDFSRLVVFLVMSISLLGFACKGEKQQLKDEPVVDVKSSVDDYTSETEVFDNTSTHVENSKPETTVQGDVMIETDASTDEILDAIDKVKKEVETKKPPIKEVELTDPIDRKPTVKEEVAEEVKGNVPGQEQQEVKEQDVKESIVEEINETKSVDSERPAIEEKPEKVHTFNIHQELDKILKTHVSSSGIVNYNGIKGDKDRLENYLALVSNNVPKAGAGRNEKLAYWINVYNAFTLKLIVDNYPVKSITDLEGGKPWDKKWIKIGSETYSLNQIENEIIRPRFKEPRIHFAVNCAAKSCPPIMNKAWIASSLEADLEKATKLFINNSKHNSFSNGNAQVSKIFEWYKEDFGDLKQYLSKYSGQTIKEISYKEYDWSLNN